MHVPLSFLVAKAFFNDFGMQVVYIDESSAALRVFPEKIKLLSKSV